MFKVLKIRLNDQNNKIYVKLFRISYITGTVSFTFSHSIFMNVGFIFKFIYEKYGDLKIAADIANKVNYYNLMPMAISLIACDFNLTVIMIILIWKKIIPLSSIWKRIFATLYNPLMSLCICGTILSYFPWPINQLKYGCQSFGYALVLYLGLILNDSMKVKQQFEEKKDILKKVNFEK